MSIRSEFQVHILNDDGIAKAEAIARMYSTFLTELENIVLANNRHDARAMALVRTKLEEASYFTKRAMAADPANQKA